MSRHNENDYEERLNRVLARHPYVNVEHMMKNDRLGLDPHEKRQIEEEIKYGRPAHGHMSKSIAKKGPQQVKILHDIAREHEDPRYRGFADDLAKEFKW